MNHQQLIDENRMLLVRTGSQLYGTATPESDEDFAGIFMPPEDCVFGLNTIEEVDLSQVDKDESGRNTSEAVDIKYRELRKFANLALQNNPNVLELLFVPEEHRVFSNEAGQRLLSNRDLFPYQGCYKRFLGYAKSQRHKMQIRTGNYDNLKEVRDFLHKIVRQENRLKLTLKDLKYQYPTGSGFSWKTSHAKAGDLNLMYHIKVGKALRMIEERLDKATNRAGLMDRYGYDCYHPETEFLTQAGWKLYDEIIDEDLLGTVNPVTHKLEWQHFTERVKKPFSGNLYRMYGHYTEAITTPNHRMYVSPCSRSKANNYSTAYNESTAVWSYIPMKDLHDGYKSRYHVMTGLNAPDDDYDAINDDYLRLVGAFVSEGCYNKFRENGTPRAARVVQTNKGKSEFIEMMDSLTAEGNRYEYDRPEKDLTETIWVFTGDTVDTLWTDCGSPKLLPAFYSKLSKRQARILLDSLMLGDGTKGPGGNGRVYYTNNAVLAGQVQIVALLAGFNSNVRGPYMSESNFTGEDISLYQVYVTDEESQPQALAFNHEMKYVGRGKKSPGGELIPYEGDVVCFTVPNENLVTRRNGKIAVQGNTKFASHLIRLLYEGLDLLEQGELIFPLPQAERILDIKQGKWEMERVLETADELEAEIELAAETTDLPKKPRYAEVEELIIDMIRDHMLN